jgi:hypothetical protein
MQSNKTKYKLIQEPNELFQMCISDQYKIIDLQSIGENMQVFYVDTEEFHEGSCDTNVAIGAFTTSYGRMTLYTELKKLDRRVLYYDTDSIIFTHKNEEYEPKLGDYLGEFTNELNPKEGNYIQEFISGGPKNYGYKLDTGKANVKIKGLSLSFETQKQINFDTMKELIINNSDAIKVDQMNFVKDKSKWSICTKNNEKIYKKVYDKRVLLDDFTTLPFGF